MPRCRQPDRDAPRRLAVVAVVCAPLWCASMWCAAAMAQTTGAIPGAVVAPDAEPKSTSRFESSTREAPRRSVASSRPASTPGLLEPLPSGAGSTGFDSSNAGGRTDRFTKKPKTKGKAVKPDKPISPAREAVPLGVVTPTGPIGRRPEDKADASYARASGAPGQPPASLGPIYTVPKKRKALGEDDPYAPLGLRSGGLLYFPAVELIGGHDSNPGQTANGGGASLYTVAPELKVKSDWLRHDLKADIRGSYTGYSPDETPRLSRPYFSSKIDGRVDVRHDTRVELGTRALVSTDNPGSPNLSAGLSKLPIFTTFGGTAGIGHTFNRLDILLKGDIERTSYRDSQLTDGTTASNETRDYKQYGGTLRASYEYVPGVKPFVEGGLDKRQHDVTPDTSGFNRDSRGFTGKVGSTFELTRVLTGEIAVGYTKREYDDARLESLKGLIGNASLIWNVSGLTTAKLTGNSTVGESTQTGVSGVLYRDVGVQIDHAFRRWLIGTVKFGFGLDDYVGSDRADKRYSAGVGLTYKLNRMVQVKGEARRDWLRSNVDGADYSANIFLIGLRLQY